jgi:hypothetical protein
VELAAAASRWGAVPQHFPKYLTPRRKQGLAEVIQEAMTLPPDQLPEKIRHEHKRLPLAVGRRAASLREKRDRRAAELGLDPSFLASRSQLLELAEFGDWTKTSLMSWQAEALVK